MSDSPFADVTSWWSWLPAPKLAPRELIQPINPGWTFGNVVIDAQNSSAPETERDIVAAESYGRQIGKLLDAVCELVGDRPESPAYRDVLALRDKVDAIKKAAAVRRIEQLAADLRLLREADETQFNEKVAALRAILPEPAPSPAPSAATELAPAKAPPPDRPSRRRATIKPGLA